MAAVLLVTMSGTVFAASALELTYHIECDDFVYVPANDANNYRIEVPSATVITIDFLIEADDDFTLSTFQNEIYFDPDFFSFMTGSGEGVKDGTRCALKEYSDKEMRVFVNTITDTAMDKKQMVASFKLLVTEDTVGAESLIETKLPKASDSNGKVSTINEKNLEVVIIAGDPNLKKHSVTYKDGDTEIDQFDVIKGQEIPLKENDIEKEDVDFVGWKVNGGAVMKPGELITVNADTTIEAVWEPKAEHLLHFDTNGGSSVPSVKAFKGDTITLTQRPTRTGYTFDGWYSDEALTTPVSSIVLNSDTTVYAKWTKDSAGGGGGGGGGTTQKHTITFKTPDGIELDKVERTSNTTVDLSRYKYDKEGYTFFGWYKDKELTEKVTSIHLTSDITLYARWIEGDLPTNKHPEILTTDHYAYIVGREANKIFPQDNITRAEVATIFFRLLTEDVRNANMTKENIFADVNDGDWFSAAVSTLAKLEIIKGRTETTFEPDANITRAEFTTIAARFSDGIYKGENFFKDINGHWAMEYINTAASLGWIVGENGIFRPDDNITRAEVMTLVNRVLGRLPESKSDMLDGMTTWEDNADETAWYYLAVQEATNSHDYEMKENGVNERWTKLTESPDWTKLEK